MNDDNDSDSFVNCTFNVILMLVDYGDAETKYTCSDIMGPILIGF